MDGRNWDNSLKTFAQNAIHSYLHQMRIYQRIFDKVRNDPNGMIRGLGETDPCRKPEVENLVALSL